MIRLILFITIMNLFAGCKTGTVNSGHSGLSLFADSVINNFIDKKQFAGASVIVFHKGEMLLDKSYGFASLELSAPMPLHTSFEIGSITKQFTAAAILRLIQEGKLSMDDDFTRYIGFKTKGRTITIRQLLNHTSGIHGYTEMPEFWQISRLQLDRDTLIRMVEKKKFLFEPGDAMLYNNTGYFILGIIIAKVSGMEYAEYLKQQFFQPLEMNNTYYCSTSEVIKNKAYGYSYSDDGLKQKEFIDHTWPYAGGSLCSTTADLLKWMRALHEGKIFDAEQYNLMISPGELNDGTRLRYALGLCCYDFYHHRVIDHGGEINGFLSEARYFPENDLYIICLLNTIGPVEASSLADILTRQILPLNEENKSEPDYDPDVMEGTYSGQTANRRITIEVIAAGNSLILKPDNSNKTDTLSHYLGNNSWKKGNSKYTFNGRELRMDNIYEYLILQKLGNQKLTLN